MSQVVEVPDSHIEEGVAHQTLDEAGCPFNWKDVIGDLFQVRHSRLPPQNAAVAVWYKGRWFYVDERDNSSKSSFNLLLEMFNLEIRAGGASQGPLLTIS